MQRTASRTNNCSTFIYVLFIFILAATFPRQIKAQGYFYWNTADKTKPWVTEINPAIVSFQNTEFSVGLKLFHVGFLPNSAFGMRESRINLSAPFYLPYDIGVGLDIRHFTAGIYSEISSALLLSKEIYPKLSIGVKVALDHRGFSKDQFNIVDPDDPLINSSLSVNALNVGGGIYWEPGQFRLGLGVDHLNTPNVGLVSESIFPKEVTGAVGYEIGLFTPTLLLHDNGLEIEYGFAITFNKPQLGRLRVGYERSMPVKLEASIALNKKTQLHYGVDLPNEGTSGASYGTQEFVYSQVIARRPVIGQPDILFSTNKLDIIYETHERFLDPSLLVADLKESKELIGQYFKPQGHDDNLFFIKAGALSEFETDEIKRDRHLKLINRIGRHLYKDPAMKVVIWADQSTIDDAREISYLLESKIRIPQHKINIAKLPPQSEVALVGFVPGRKMSKRLPPRLSSEQVVISFEVPGRTRKTYGWQFVIKDSFGKPVRIFSGNGNLPKEIAWDWKDMDGHNLAGGVYTGFLKVKANEKVNRNAQSIGLPVYNIKRTVKMKMVPDKELNLTDSKNELDSEILDTE